jgi:hypothetical protein
MDYCCLRLSDVSMCKETLLVKLLSTEAAPLVRDFVIIGQLRPESSSCFSMKEERMGLVPRHRRHTRFRAWLAVGSVQRSLESERSIWSSTEYKRTSYHALCFPTRYVVSSRSTIQVTYSETKQCVLDRSTLLSSIN